MNPLAPIAVTMGEPAGIGGDITLKAWAKRHDASLPSFFVIDDADRLSSLADRLGLSIPMKKIEDPADALDAFGSALPVIHQPLSTDTIPGIVNSSHSDAIIASIEQAVSWVARGVASAVVTNPIQKSSLYEAGFGFPGHTELLSHLCVRYRLSKAPHHPVMMLSIPSLRVVPLTGHMPLANVSESLSQELIAQVCVILVGALRSDLGIANPRIAVAGLNPHAGESGGLGKEETDIISPAIETLRKKGIDVSGPNPADTMFYQEARAHYDVALCMYHDQALAPLKALDFDRGVNTTLGLPLIRTSPDHGTALNLAGTGQASPTSLIEALHQAHFIAGRRASQS